MAENKLWGTYFVLAGKARIVSNYYSAAQMLFYAELKHNRISKPNPKEMQSTTSPAYMAIKPFSVLCSYINVLYLFQYQANVIFHVLHFK